MFNLIFVHMNILEMYFNNFDGAMKLWSRVFPIGIDNCILRNKSYLTYLFHSFPEQSPNTNTVVN